MTDLLFVAHTGNVSGAEVVLLDLIAEAIARGHRVRLACPDGPLVERLPADCTHVRLPALGLAGETGPARYLGAARLAGRYVAAARVLARAADDRTRIVVNSLAALPAVRLARTRCAATWLVHDTVVSRRQRAMITFAAPAVTTAVAVSHATADSLADFDLAVLVRHNGVDWPVAPLPVHEPAAGVIGMLALLTPWKGQDVLLDAVASLDDVQVELAGGQFPGDEEYVARLRARAARPDLAGRVRFLGHVAPVDAMAGWDALVSASVLPEAGPLSVLEAMSHGVPVIGTDHGGTTEFLTGGAGVLVAPDDSAALARAIKAILADPAQRRSIAERQRARIADRHDRRETIAVMLAALIGE